MNKIQDVIDQLDDIKEQLDFLRNKRMSQVDYLPGSIKQRHIEANIIFFGLSANRPAGDGEVKVYYATDTNILYLWDGTTWRSH